MAIVHNYETGAELVGRASPELVAESLKSSTGAVPAYRDLDRIWHFVRPSQVEHYRKNLRFDVKTVYVMGENPFAKYQE